MDDLVTLLLSIWSFRKWSDSRWLSMGPSCRTLVAALSCGLRPFVSWILSRPGVSRYFLGGFQDHYSTEVTELVGIVATSSFAADAALVSMLEDDRLVHTAAALHDDMRTEVEYIANIPDLMWSFLGAVLGREGSSLRHSSISGDIHPSEAWVFLAMPLRRVYGSLAIPASHL